MANVSAKQTMTTETSAFREWFRGSLPKGVTFRTTPYKIGRAFAELDEVEGYDFAKAVERMLGYIAGADAEFADYARGYRDRVLEFCETEEWFESYVVDLKAAFKMGA
jgi:hypothetical protein